MAAATRLEKTIKGINAMVLRHGAEGKFIFSNEKLIIDNRRSQSGAALLILAIFFLPLGIGLYYIITDHISTIIFWLFLLEIVLINDFYKLIRGAATLTIDFRNKYMQVDKPITGLKGVFPSRMIPFSELSQVLLKEKASSFRQGGFQLIAVSRDIKAFVLTDFSRTYPESLIADKIKFLIEVIIWTEKGNEKPAGLPN